QPAASSLLPEKPRTVPPPRQPVVPKPAAKPAQQGPRTTQQRPPAPAPGPAMPPAAVSSVVVDVPVHVPSSGVLHAVDAPGRPSTFTTPGEPSDTPGRPLIVHIPPPDRDRATTLTWMPDATPPELPTPQPQASETLPAGKPRFFELVRNERLSMILEVQ